MADFFWGTWVDFDPGGLERVVPEGTPVSPGMHSRAGGAMVHSDHSS